MRLLLACLLLASAPAFAQEPPTVLLDLDGPAASTATAEVTATVWRALVAIQLDARTARPIDAIERECQARKRLTETRGAEPFPETATLSADVVPDLVVQGSLVEGALKLVVLDAKGGEVGRVEAPFDGQPAVAVGFWVVEDLIQLRPLRPHVRDADLKRIQQLIAEHYPRRK